MAEKKSKKEKEKEKEKRARDRWQWSPSDFVVTDSVKDAPKKEKV